MQTTRLDRMVAGTRVVMMGLGVDLRDIKDLGLGHHA